MAFCRRLARATALLQTPPESLAGSPGLFESPSEDLVGQTAPRLPYSPGSSMWEVGVEVDIFFGGNRGLKSAPFRCFGDGLVQNISYDFLGGLRHLHFSKKLINVYVHVGHALYHSRMLSNCMLIPMFSAIYVCCQCASYVLVECLSN